MKTPEIRSLYVLDILFVAYHSHGHSFPLEMFHSSDLEPHASPGLPECERRNPKPSLDCRAPSPPGRVVQPTLSETGQILVFNVEAVI